MKKKLDLIILNAVKYFLLGATATLIIACLTGSLSEDHYIIPIIGVLSAGLGAALGATE